MNKDQRSVLMVSTTASMIEQFNLNNLKILLQLGAVVHVATNFEVPGTITKESSLRLKSRLEKIGVKCHQVDFKRGFGNPVANRKAYRQLCSVVEQYKISYIHTHSPLGSIIARRVARHFGIKILYTAHGFQFFAGGPLINWLVFWPIEWYYAHWTDAIVTINTDDYHQASFLPVKRRYYLPGVGTDIKQSMEFNTQARKKLRQEFRNRNRIDNDDFLIVSVGELSKRKNHDTVIRAIKKLNDPSIKYLIAGIGPEKENLKKLINSLGLENQVKFMGYIENLNELYFAADLNVFVSRREGLGLGGLDGVAHGLYIIGNGRTGMKDYIYNERVGLLLKNPNDADDLAHKIKVVQNERRKVTISAIEPLLKFDFVSVNEKMEAIYYKEFFS